MRGYKRTKAHHLLPKLPFSRKGSGSTDPIISSPDKSSSIEVGPLSQEPPVCPTPVLPTSPNSYPYHSNTTMLLAILPRPDSRAASTKSRRSDNLFKKLLGKQPSFPSQTVLKSRPEKRGKEFRFGFQSSHATENGNDRPELDTPTSACGPHWDCAKTVYRGSVEVKTPIFPKEGLAFYDMVWPTDKGTSVDSWSTHQSTTDPSSKGTPSPKRLLNREGDTYPPIGDLDFATRPLSLSECSVNTISSTDAREHSISQTIGSRNEEEEPTYPVPQFNPPKHEREIRRTSLMLRRVSSGGPAPQVLSPPPIKVRFPARRGITVPLPSPRRRSRQAIRHPQLLSEPVHKVSQPGSPSSLTPEEGLIELRVRTRQAESNLPVGYRRSFKHVRGLNSRALPTPPLPSGRPFRPLPPLPVPAPANVQPNNLGGADNRSQFESPTKLISPSSGTSGRRAALPDIVLDIATTWTQQGSSPTSKHPWCARQEKFSSTFLDLDPSVLQTPLSPKPLNAVH